jgi:large subunit ribosomal protein L1
MKKQRDNKEYNLEDGIKKVKEESRAKFDASVELHINLNIDPAKQNIRFPVTLPHGTGKTQKVAVLSSTKIPEADLSLEEEDLKKIEKGDIKPGEDFDILITEPDHMAKIAKYARILGPAGVMPNPKNGTVTEDISKAVAQFKKGKVEIKTEKLAPLIHTVIGKVSFEDNALKENFKEILNNLKQNKPAKASPQWIEDIYLTSSMGPSVKINLEI